MQNIYELKKFYNNYEKVYFYEDEHKMKTELGIEFEFCLKEFKNKDKDMRETYLSYKNYMLKTNNLKEAINLSGLDEEDVKYDLKLNDLDKDITFEECEYILRNIEDENINNLFEVVEEKYPFYIGSSGKDIDKNFAYNYFKEKIKLELDFQFNKDDFIEVFKNIGSEKIFKKEVFENIKLLDGKVKAIDLGLTEEYFNEELSTLCEDCHIGKIINEYKERKEDEKMYDEVYNTRYSSSYIYIGYIEDIPEIIVCNERCIPEWFEVVEEINTDNFEYIKQQYLGLHDLLKFELPKQGNNEELYCFLRKNTNIDKKQLIKLFNENSIYQDVDRNMVFVIKNNKDINIGAYKWDIYSKTKNMVVVPYSNMSKEQEDNITNFTKNIYAQIFKQEEIQKVADFEMEI